MSFRTLNVYQLGRVGYAETHALQERLLEARIGGSIGDVVLLVEHPDVLTLGRGAKMRHVLLSAEELARRGYDVHEVGRGGDVTYHGPGQLVVYPIVDLKPDRQDVRRYVWTLEEAMIRTVRAYEIEAGRESGLHGIWVEDRKIGAVGVRIRRWVTMHGFALNVTTDLSRFEAIVPCGIEDRQTTSIEREKGLRPGLVDVGLQAVVALADLFGATWQERPVEELPIEARSA